MKIVTLHVEESADGQTYFGDVADILQALADQHFGHDPSAKAYVENLAERARMTEGIYQRNARKEGG